MGSRGSMVSVKTSNFTFREAGRIYRKVGMVGNIKVLVQTSGSVKAPEYSHTANRIYAIVQNGEVKHLAYYDKDHHQAACIDFGHPHDGLRPHKHLYMNHKKGEGVNLNSKDRKLIVKLKRRYKVQCE